MSTEPERTPEAEESGRDPSGNLLWIVMSAALSGAALILLVFIFRDTVQTTVRGAGPQDSLAAAVDEVRAQNAQLLVEVRQLRQELHAATQPK